MCNYYHDYALIHSDCCIASACPALGALASGTSTVTAGSGSTTGSVVTFACNTNYVLVGSASTSCAPSGQWSASLPTCSGKLGVVCGECC